MFGSGIAQHTATTVTLLMLPVSAGLSMAEADPVMVRMLRDRPDLEGRLRCLDIKIAIKQQELAEAQQQRAEIVAEIVMPYMVSLESEG